MKRKIGQYILDLLPLGLVILFYVWFWVSRQYKDSYAVLGLALLLILLHWLNLLWICIRSIPIAYGLFGNRTLREDLALTQIEPKKIIRKRFVRTTIISLLPVWMYYIIFLIWYRNDVLSLKSLLPLLLISLYILETQLFAIATCLSAGNRMMRPEVKTPSPWIEFFIAFVKTALLTGAISFLFLSSANKIRGSFGEIIIFTGSLLLMVLIIIYFLFQCRRLSQRLFQFE